MKNNRHILVLSLALLLTVVSLGIAGKSSANSATGVAPSPTPKAAPIPKPTSVLAPTPTPPSAKTQTLDDLQSKIRQRMLSPDVRRGRVGIKIVSLNSGKVIFENDADKYFIPASNMKNFTVAAALEALGPDFRFVTSVYAGAMPDAAGTVKSDLRIFGRGDISISTAFFGTTPTDPETYYKGIDRLVDKIAAAGVKRIEGSIVGDESYFQGNTIPATWEWDDLQWKDGTEVSVLPINDNDVDISVRPGPVMGGPCIVAVSPPNTLYRIENDCQTIGSGQKRYLIVNKKLDENLLTVRGTVPADDKGFTGVVTFTHPAELFVTILKERLIKRGIVVTGNVQTRDNAWYLEHNRPPSARSFTALVLQPTNSSAQSGPIEIARLESPPFSIIAAKTMKPSQNMYTETILWTLGEQIGRKAGASGESSRLGLNVVREFMKQIGVPDDGILQYDGSGMSRHDLITPSAVVTLYTYMAKQSKYAQVWRDSLAIGGVDGTLRTRFKGTAAEGNIRGKTGTLDQVSALSGYITTAGGEQIVLSIIVNDVAETGTRTSLIDDIAVQLANFNGKID